MDKITIANLKKTLSQKTKDELIQEISTLYENFSQVKDYYKAQGSDAKKVVKRYKDIIEKEFIVGKTRGLPKARLSVARKAVTDFKKITDNPELLAEIMFTYVESISWFNDECCVDTEKYYTSSENMFEGVLKLLQNNNILDKFEKRAHTIVKKATDSYGYQDTLQERYEEVYGEFKE
jgi:hypothetical protein